MKTNLHAMYGTNKKFEQEGVDFVVSEKDEKAGTEEVSFRVRRFNGSNPRVKSAMAQYYKPHARQIQSDTLSVAKGNHIAMCIFIDVCLVSWVGVKDAEGKPIECNKENALKLFQELPDLFAALQEHSNNHQNYKDEVGNS